LYLGFGLRVEGVHIVEDFAERVDEPVLDVLEVVLDAPLDLERSGGFRVWG